MYTAEGKLEGLNANVLRPCLPNLCPACEHPQGTVVLCDISTHYTLVKLLCFVDQALSIFSTLLWVDHIGGKVVA